MFNCLLNLELHFLDLASFVMLFFGVEIVGICKIYIGRSKIKDGDCFPIAKTLGIAY